MDLALFNALHGLSGLSPWGDALIVFFAEWYLYVVLLVVAYAAWRDWKLTPRALNAYGAAVSAALVARFAVAELIRHWYPHDRPYITLGVSHLINDTASSFPSGHTIFVFALAAAANFINVRLALFLYVSGFIIGAARVAAGVHYPSDIAGGIILGVVTGAGIALLVKKFLPSYWMQ